MIKLFERIFWHNNTTPAINEDNLNAMSKAIDDIDNRVIDLGADVMEVVPQIQAYLDQAADLVEAMELLTKNPPYIGANGNWYVWDTDTSSFVDSGIDASITVQIADVTMLAYGTAPYITNSGTSTDPVFHLFIPRAAGITSITKTGTSGLVDTYTVTFQDGNTSTFQVTNGKGIVSIAKTSTSGLVDTYTITFNDSTTTTFTVTNGNGDMNKSTYDPQSAVENAGGISNYVSGAVSSLKSALTNKLDNEIVTRSAMGAKNLLWHDITAMKTYNTAGTWSNNVYSKSGIDWTVNDDGTVTANGTATADSELTFNTSGSVQAISGLETNNYILNGCPSGGSGTTYRLFAKCTDSNYYQDDGNGATINVGISYVRMVVYSGQTVNNITFKPMVRLATDSDATYQPYAKTNKELTDDVAALNASSTTSVTEKGIKANFTKVGNVKTIELYSGSLNENVAADGVILTVPVGYRPFGHFSFITNNIPSSKSDRVTIVLQSDGRLQVSGTSLSSGDALRGCATYV